MREGKKKSLFPHHGHLSVKDAADGSRKLVRQKRVGQGGNILQDFFNL